MPETPANVAPFYDGWENYQKLLITAIAPLTDEQLTLRAAPNLRSIGENMLHIIAVRARWFHNFMGEGGEDLHHGGEVSLMLGLHGLTAPDL